MSAKGTGLYAPPREEWLSLHHEDALEPEQPILDAHHHLWSREGSRYLTRELLSDLDTGHRIVGTVFVECRSMYRQEGPAHLKPVGEVEFVDSVAAMAEAGNRSGICSGIVGHCNLAEKGCAGPALEAMKEASPRLRGIRQVSAWDADGAFHHPAVDRPPGLLLDKEFRAGFSCLGKLGLVFDAFLYFTQLDELASLASAFPTTTIILDHLGAPLGVGVYADKRHEVFSVWRRKIASLAERPNVFVKIGGLGMRSVGLGFHERPRPPSSVDLADAWRPFVDTVLEHFGPSRAMFESNFPPDKASCSYAVLWNAFKRLSSGYSHDERADLFWATAERVYRLGIQP